ncbi:MAG: glycine/sarcosine/betaine reductase component B subunit [Cloacibacillus evryensis]
MLVFEPVEGIEPHEYEKACRLAGFRAALYVAEAAWKAERPLTRRKPMSFPRSRRR